MARERAASSVASMSHALTTPGIARLGFRRPELRLGQTEAVWLGIVGFMVCVKVLSLTLVPITFRSAGQQSLFDWSSIAIYGVLGLIGIWCGRATGFPEALQRRSWLWLPVAIGVSLGAIEIGIDLLTHATQIIAQLTGEPSFNIDFPGSLLAYSGGGIQVEIEYRLFTLPFLLFLISNVILRGRGRTPTLIVLGVISAALEPVTQGVFIFIAGGGVVTPLMLLGYMVTALPGNALAVVLYRRYGLLAPLALRMGEYTIWHILYGNFLYGLVNP
jgi:hypothetical protein